MGFFDLFKSGKPTGPAPTPAGDKNVARFAKFAGDKRAQNYDRMEALESLARIPSKDAASALLKRFTFHIDPSITDQEEKDVALRGILAAGEDAIEPIRAFCHKAESLAWPLRILKELLPAERYAEEIVRLLETFDVEYARNTDPKQQLLSELEAHKVPGGRAAAERFLEDVAEPVRFVAVAATFAQEDAAAAPALVKALAAEESVRVKNRIGEGLAARGWAVADADRATLRSALPSAFVVAETGVVRRR